MEALSASIAEARTCDIRLPSRQCLAPSQRLHNQPIPDTSVPYLQTCEILHASLPLGGRPITVKRRGVDAGEREEPLEPARRGFFTGTGPEKAGPYAGSLNAAKRMECRPQRAGRRPAPAGGEPLPAASSATSGDANHAGHPAPPGAFIDLEIQSDRTTGGPCRPEGGRVSDAGLNKVATRETRAPTAPPPAPSTPSRQAPDRPREAARSAPPHAAARSRPQPRRAPGPRMPPPSPPSSCWRSAQTA